MSGNIVHDLESWMRDMGQRVDILERRRQHRGTGTGNGGGGEPTGPAGGDLTGTYPNPQVKDKDGAPTTPSMRTLGGGAQQAAAGNHSHDTSYIPPSLIDAKGDLIVGTANDTVTRLGAGTNGYVLIADSAQAGGMRWSPAPGADEVHISNDIPPAVADLWVDLDEPDPPTGDGGSGTPGGAAGGDLSGTYPNPQIAAGVIVHGDVAAANKDGAVDVPSMRTLGTGPLQAAPGDHTHPAAPSVDEVLIQTTQPAVTTDIWIDLDEPDPPLSPPSIPPTLIDAKGDLMVGTANDTVARLAVGSNNFVLIADSSQPGGMRWAAPSATGADLSYVHTQAALSTTWTVNHMMGRRPSVNVQDAVGNVITGSVRHVDNNQLVITFYTAITGTAHCD